MQFITGAHEHKFEKTDDDRRQHEISLVPVIEVEDQAPVRHVGEFGLQGLRIHPRSGDEFLEGGGAPGQPARQLRFLRRKQEGKYAQEVG